MRSLRGENVTDVEMYIQNPATGNVGRFISITSKPMWNNSGDIVGAVAVFRDTTERREQERKLKLSEEKFRLAFEEGAFGFAMLDEAMHFTRVNRALCEMLGYTREELVGRNVLEITHVEDQAQSLKLRDELLTRRIDKMTYEKRYVTKSGQTRWVNLTVNPVFDHEKKFQFFFTLIEDITEKKVVQQREQQVVKELARSNAELQQFAYAASHDLKEPLRMVAMFSELIRQKYGRTLDREGKEYIEYATDGVKRMHALIDALLEFSRVSRNMDKKTPTDLNRVVELAKSNVALMLAETGARVRAARLPVVEALEPSMVQLFQNLMSNAVKFRSDRPPLIEIDAKETREEWIVSVRDNGIGIEPQFHDRVFVLFQRLHSREDYPGSGIGLSICKKIVEGHGGRMWVESKLGSGACFYFSLPRSKSD
jgi:PAS domain S-box-containing protein